MTQIRSPLRAFVRSPLRARAGGQSGILQWVEHLEQYDDRHPHDVPPVSQDTLINTVQGLPWSILTPFNAEIQNQFSNPPFDVSIKKRSYNVATAKLADNIFAPGAYAFSSMFLTFNYFPTLPVIRGIPYNGQPMFGSCAYWSWASSNPGAVCIPYAGKSRIKWSIDSTVFVVSAEFTQRWGPTAPGDVPWTSADNDFFLKNFQLLHSMVSLPAGTWFDVDIIPDVRGPFWDGTHLTFSDGFMGMFTLPIFFETPSEWQTRTGIML